MKKVRDAALPRRAHSCASWMGGRKGILALLAGLLAINGAQASGKHPWEDYDKRLESSRSPAALGSDLFGDSVNLQDGALSFSATDVSLPGNNGLPVSFSRSYKVFNRRDYGDMGVLADWALDLPRISADTSQEWLSSTSGGNRCSDTTGTQPAPSGFQKTDYFHGLQLEIPGVGGGELLIRDSATPGPTDGTTYQRMTADQIHVSCLASIDNRTGEGFLAVTPDGTKVWFKWMAQDLLPYMEAARYVSGDYAVWSFNPRKTSLYATRVEDAAGNWVQYSYGNAWNQTVQLNSITSSDGRTLTVAYAGGRVASVSNGTQTWQYQYETTTSGRATLTAVILPDASRWSINFAAFTNAELKTTRANEMLATEIYRTCRMNEYPLNGADQPAGSITHPSGATGTFTTDISEHGLSHVPVSCGNYATGDPYWGNNPNDDVNLHAMKYFGFTLRTKTITGPGLAAMSWSYDYVPNLSWFWAGNASMQYPVCTLGAACHDRKVCNGGPCEGAAITTVTGPNGTWERYSFGNSFKYNEGKLLKLERGSGPTNILETTVNTYDLSLVDQVYPARFGHSQRGRDDFAVKYHRPMVKRDITTQGATFTWQIEPTCGGKYCTDAQANPTLVRRYSTLGYSRTEATSYWNDFGKWIIGRVASVTCNPAVPADSACNGDIVEQSTFDALGRPLTKHAFGKLQHTLTYNADGTLATYKDGRNLVTSLSNWYRSVPRNIGYPDGTSVSAAVNATGTIASVTSEVGAKTCYDYDAMGRLATITYQSESQAGICNGSAWNQTSQAFAQVGGTEYGIPAGHWRQTVNTGNGVKVVYYDAMWRPLLTHEYDAANVAATQRFVRFAYDGSGRTAFASYPSTSSNPTTGVWTLYDALGRPTSVSQDSEHGLLTSTTGYLTGFQTQVTNPRGFQTTTSYKAFDTPSTDWPAAIVHPENARTTIHRDAFGKPLWIERWGALAGQPEVTRWYVYDAHQQLCKTIEPETAATAMAYDAAGNLAWSAGGQPLWSTTDCEAASVQAAAKVLRTYDARNRLDILDFSDDNGDQDWTYTPDGLPQQVVTYNDGGTTSVVNGYTYNNRRLLVHETSSQPGWYTWNSYYGFNANGHLAGQTYPTALYVDYAPNALGQPTRAGTYATGVNYYPNGAIKQFTYGNGIVHTMQQNARQLPARTSDLGGPNTPLDYAYTYDANGNVGAIVDHALGSAYNRTMAYDGLDRLTDAGSSAFGGDAWHRFTYDVLDNIRSWKLPGVKDYADYWYNPANNRLESIRNSAGATIVGLGYDAQGNLATKNGQAYQFDYGNRLRHVPGREYYRYDGHGRRVLNGRPSTLTLSMYSNAGQLLYQENGSRRVAIEHIYLQGSLVATRDRPYSSPTPDIHYRHTDGLGSPVAMTNGAGQVIDRTQYEPYGESINTTTDGVGYTGHVEDAATGLTYMQQRYYDSGIGRFLSVDPVTASNVTGANFNRYWYAADNPYRFTDPDGRMINDRLPWRDRSCPPTCSMPRLPEDHLKQLDLTIKGSEKFKKQVAAVEGKSKEAGIDTFQKLRDAEGLTEIIESNRTRFIGGMAEGRSVAQIFWNPTEGALVKVTQLTGGLRLQSPAAGLMHEIGHAAQFILMGAMGIGPNEENAVIFGIETIWANYFGEPIRDPFRAHGGMTVDDKGLFDHE